MKKEIKINMSKLTIGGMEHALIDLLKMSDLREKYNITLMIVYSGKNNYLNEIPKSIKVDLLWNKNFNIIGKLVVSLKLLKRLILKKNYYASVCYTHHHKILSKLSRKESDNSIIFIHTDLINSRNEKELNTLCNSLKFDEFKKVACVSECAKNSFMKIYPKYNGIVSVINNYINGHAIIEKSNEKIKDIKKEKITTFINVARHEEDVKKISRIINSTKKLNKEGYKFRVLLIGEGEDTPLYKNMIEIMNLDNIELLYNKLNPFPYYKLSDAFLFSSSSEGYGIVLNEARVLSIPIISTDVADASLITKEGYGILCENSEDGIYSGMKKYLEEGYKIKKEFDYNKFNERITNKINLLLEEI